MTVNLHAFGTEATMRDQATALVAVVRPDQPALEQGGKDVP